VMMVYPDLRPSTLCRPQQVSLQSIHVYSSWRRQCSKTCSDTACRAVGVRRQNAFGICLPDLHSC
jgi:hypothetical protein